MKTDSSGQDDKSMAWGGPLVCRVCKLRRLPRPAFFIVELKETQHIFWDVKAVKLGKIGKPPRATHIGRRMLLD